VLQGASSHLSRCDGALHGELLAFHHRDEAVCQTFPASRVSRHIFSSQCRSAGQRGAQVLQVPRDVVKSIPRNIRTATGVDRSFSTQAQYLRRKHPRPLSITINKIENISTQLINTHSADAIMTIEHEHNMSGKSKTTIGAPFGVYAQLHT
jgi:hypothetical protein